jgi:cell division protein FtsQ
MAQVLAALPPEVLVQVDSISARTRDDVTLSLTGSDQRVVWGSASDSDRKALVLAALLGQFATAGPGEYDVSAPGTAVFRRD